MQRVANNQPDLITINVNPARFKNVVYKSSFWLFLVVAGVIFAIVRDFITAHSQQTAAQQGSQINQGLPILSTMMVTPKNNVSGATFTVPVARKVHITIKDSTGNKIVINKLDGEVVCTYAKSDVDEDVYLAQGQYVISLIANKAIRARAFVEIR